MVFSVARYRCGMAFDFPYCLKGLGAAKIDTYKVGILHSWSHDRERSRC